MLAALDERARARQRNSISAAPGSRRPSSTWTYLVNDDPFRNRIGALLTGPGGATVAIYAAAMMMPLLVLWGLVESFLRREPRRRSIRLGPVDAENRERATAK